MSTIKVSFNGVFYAQEDETTIFETVFYRWSLRNILGGDSTDTEIDIDVEYNEPSEDDEDDEDDEEDSDDDESEDDDD
ncbi:hypothetical protein P7C73_g417, partial [Tremellales sp. Uapishka_1]